MVGDLGLFPWMGGLSLTVLIIVMIWSSIWKAIALWKSGRNNQLVWFIVLFLLNTVGILEIIYLVWFHKKPRAAKRYAKKKAEKISRKKRRKRE